MPQQTRGKNPNSDGMTDNPYWMKNRVTSED